MTNLKKTPLYDVHVARGARIVPFAGFEMPVQYEGVIAEHVAVRERIGLFDVSHMGEVTVCGPSAMEALQFAVTNDVSRLEDGQALYTVMCRDDGGIVDDLIVYRESTESFFLCINASRRDEDFSHLLEVCGGYDCELTDVSEEYAQIAVQGPKSEALLKKLDMIDLETLKPFHWQDRDMNDWGTVRIARTGYTGEDGVELYCRPESAVAIWEALENAGEEFGVSPCGLGARDTLRLEMKFALYGNDITDETNPMEAGLGWVVKLDKGSFKGCEVLRRVKESKPSRRLIGFKMLDRGIARKDYPMGVAEEVQGVVTSGNHSPSLGYGIGLGYVARAHAKAGTQIQVEVRGRWLKAEVVKTPFYKRGNE
ncbi:MAG: glycine cleavage system aminomethyltransferase GcvT [Myxococcota bacterium]|nr:glycine cleavage system aminomethyltransferase GcvT [Myxococcota bacterium]